MKNSTFNCTNLSKSYLHRRVFEKLNFSLRTGISLGITGRNGTGKSTLIKVVSGIISPSKGELTMTVNNSPVKKESFYKHLGLMSPYLNLYDELTGYENLEFFNNLKSEKSPSENQERIHFLLESVGLFKRRKELYKNYSSGMKQRLKLAFALLNEPELLLFDEPCSNLDKEGIDVVYKFADEQRKKGMLIIATNEESDLFLCDSFLNIEDYKK